MNAVSSPTSETLSQLFLDAEKVFGSRDSCFLAMESIKSAVRSFSGTSQEMEEEIMCLARTVTDMSPRIALLIMMTSNVLHEYMAREPDLSLAEEKDLLCAIIDKVQCKRKKSVEKLLNCSDGIIVNGDTVLLHDISHTVFDVLKRAHDRGVEFDVLVAAQEERQTEKIVAFLQETAIPFSVVAEYLLIHVIDTVTKAFLGAVTVNSYHEVISDAGSRAIVSQMKHHNVPVYVPITTDKMSLWKAQHKHHSLKTVHYKSVCGCEYNKLIFSHDRYPVGQVTRFITNKGCLTPQELTELYERYFGERELWRAQTGV